MCVPTEARKKVPDLLEGKLQTNVVAWNQSPLLEVLITLSALHLQPTVSGCFVGH